MADNVPIQPASSVSAVPVAADEIAGTMHQRAKVQHGADGSATDVSAASPLPSGGYLWTGSAWVPAPGDAASGAKVDTELPPAAAVVDGTPNPTTPAVDACQELFNGATWDRARGNQSEAVALASAARTGLVTSPTLVNHNGRGILLRTIITTAGTGSLTLTVRTSSNFILATFTVTASGLCVMCPGVGSETPGVVAANRSSMPLPRDALLTCSTPDSWTYELRYSLLV